MTETANHPHPNLPPSRGKGKVHPHPNLPPSRGKGEAHPHPNPPPSRGEGEAGQETLELLEFGLIRQQLSRYATLAPAQEAAAALTPSSNLELIRQRQQATLEARAFLDNQGSVDLTGVADIRDLIQRATLTGVLRAEHLRQIHDTLRACRRARALLAHRRDLPLISGWARAIPSLRDLEDRIAGAIDPNGLMMDNATPALRQRRMEADQARARLSVSMEREMRKLGRGNVLQEQLITERNGRLVLLIKSSLRQRVPGIVHDVSDSGATAFIEPLGAVPLGNKWREAALSARREEERILRSLSSQVGLQGPQALASLDLLGQIDFALAKGRLSLSQGGTPPVFVDEKESRLKLKDARHPLLGDSAVPIDLNLGGAARILLITGPNAGGKTVALKTAGLLTAMAQAGLHVPAGRCQMTVFDAVFADIGDQQSIEQSLSSFSSHLQNLRNIMEGATGRSLVLLDELGASTDPEEAAALAKATLSFFARRGVACIVTTHHRDVAAFAQDQPAMTNASVELNQRTLAPTYRLATGLPGRSYALTIAERMGIDAETVEYARTLLSEDHRRAEELLRKLEQEKAQAEKHRKSVQQEARKATAERRKLEKRLEDLEADKAVILEQARQQIQAKADDLWKRLRRAERALARPDWKRGLKDERVDVAKVRSQIRSSLAPTAPLTPEAESASYPAPNPRSWVEGLKRGDFVYVRGLPNPAEVLEPSKNGGSLELLLGSVRATIPSHQIERKAEKPTSPQMPEGVTFSRAATGPAKTELDLRGMRVEAAEMEIDDFLDQALMKGLSSVRIVHGGGTGALRSLVRERLKGHPTVKDARPENVGLTDGATLVELV